MGIGGGSAPPPPAAVTPIKPPPPPAQMSASLLAVRDAKANATAGGALDGTILAGNGAPPPLRSPGDVLYGKQLTGA